MNIYAQQIPVHGREFNISHEEAWVSTQIEKSFNGRLHTCKGNLTLSNHKKQIHVIGTLSALLQLKCDVCAADIEVLIEGKVNLLYVPAATPDPNFVPRNEHDLNKIDEMILLEDEDLDIGWYYDGVLELGVVLTEFLLINKGAILQCSDVNVTRMNEGQCTQHSTKAPKNTYKPFAGLDIS